MSWIFSFLLGCYLLVRLVLRARGQLRWLVLRKTLPVPPQQVEAPAHLSPTLGRLFVGSRELRVALIEARHTLARVRVTDPDATFGRVRDACYRRALMQTWSHINRWLRAVRELDEGDAGHLGELHLGPDTIEQLRDALRAPWQAVAHARALDPFELEQLDAVAATFERVGEELERIERGLMRLGDDPYRDRFSTTTTTTTTSPGHRFAR